MRRTPRQLVALPCLVALAAAATTRPVAAQTPAAPPPGRADSAAGRSPGVIRVEMVENGPYGMAFSPVRVTAQPGDTLRFVQRGRAPHNVVFKSGPPDADLAALGAARQGPLLWRVGETHDVVLDERFRPGRWVYVCAPHEVLGMAGIVNVRPAAP
jgi:plastocyanin